MLSKIFIKNYILINELELDFSKGLNIITGETGAGKSILINAIDIVAICVHVRLINSATVECATEIFYLFI